MNKYLLSLLLVVGSFGAFAQLANWNPGASSAYLNFPAYESNQINGFCRISQFTFHPTDTNKMYAVTPEGGFFTTTDGGNNWVVKAGFENNTNKTASVCVDYTNDQTIYIGTGDPDYYSNGQGVYKSTDGGTTFSPTSLTNCLVLQILQDPTADSVFVAATNKGVYKTTDNGLTWTATTSTSVPYSDLKKNMSPNSQTLYACTNENSSRFYISYDFGSTWTQTTNGITTAVVSSQIQSGGRIGLTPIDTNVIYFSKVGGLGIVHLSTDAGLNFSLRKAEGAPNLTGYDTTVVAGGGQGNYNNSIAVDLNTPGRLWYTSHNMWISNDSGATWIYLHKWSQVCHTDAKQMQEAPFNGNKLFTSNDGGIWVSTDNGVNWTPKSNGLYAYEVGSNTGKSSHTDRYYTMIGTQDNGRIYRDATRWATTMGGDDYEPKEYDYLPNGGYVYNLGNISRSGPRGQLGGGGASFNLPSTGNINSVAFTRKMTNLGFIARGEIYRTFNLSASSPTWVQISTFGATIVAMHSCIADTNKLYVITDDGKIRVSSNALSVSPTFTTYTLPSATNSIASIAAVANNANTVYISINNKVYVSTNSGASWTNITYNLPNVDHRKILAEEFGGTQELVFVATNNAVYYKKSGQTTWTNYSTNLPTRRGPTDFSMFDDGTNQARIRYASFGRAMFETAFDNLRVFDVQIAMNDKTIDDSTSVPTLTCASPTLQFADGSVGKNNGPYTYSWSFPGGTPSSSSIANPTVTYPASGYYSISLTVTDASSISLTKTVSRYIQVVSCATDTIPGNAISVAGGLNYAKTGTINLGTTNNVTLSTWVKISGTQPSFAGIIATGAGGAASLNFMNSNQIGYTWNDNPSTYNYSGGPTIPTGKWTHLALVITASNATIFVNGVPYTSSVSNSATTFNSTWNLGNDRDNSSRTMTGLMDEVCMYNRSLSQTEVRELMNLTKNHGTVDTNLKAYYQCNEIGSTIYDRVGTSNATLQGSSSHALSSAPVGGGVAQTIAITAGGTASFTTPGVELTFPVSGTFPNGDLVVTRLNVPSDQAASVYTLPASPKSYYVIRNYGTNSTFTSLTGMKFLNVQGISPYMVSTPAALSLFKRGSNDDGATWGSSIDKADAVTNSGGVGTVEFTTGLSNTSFSQFSIGAASAPLALHLVSFDASVLSKTSGLLNWNVQSEIGLNAYEVERSIDASHFESIVSQNALGKNSYQFVDERPNPGKNYYRLSMIKNNGTKDYSVIRELDFSAKPTLVVKPNPTETGIIGISLQNLEGDVSYNLTITDAAGRLVKAMTQDHIVPNTPYTVFVGNSGLYLVRVVLSNGLSFAERVIVR